MLEYNYDLIDVGCRHRKSKIEESTKFYKGGLGGIVGKATDFVGLTDYSSQDKAQKQATAQGAQATEVARNQLDLSKQQLDFSKQQYADWQKVYGPIQQNLADYYTNLSGDTLVAKQLSAQAREYADAYRQAEQQLAQRGLTQSGIAAAQSTAMDIQGANVRAGIRAGGTDQAMQQKAGFLQLGLGQQATLLGGINTGYNAIGNASNSLMTGLTNQSNQNYKTYGTLDERNANVMSSLTGGFIRGSGQSSGQQSGIMSGQSRGQQSGIMSGMMSMFSDVRLKKNIKFIKEENGYNIYSWDWNDKAIELGIDNEPTTGVLAQELLHTDAVSKHTNGYYTIDYSKIGVNNAK